MAIQALVTTLPRLSFKATLAITAAALFAAAATYWATPKLVEIQNAPQLEDSIPKQFGDWKEQPSPFVQVSLTTGPEDSWNRPYDQTVMRTYMNSQGQQIMLALAWGKRQRQEAKVHRPDLCYVAQGFPVKSLVANSFGGLLSTDKAVSGKHMVVMSPRGGEAVSYWIRIGTLYSENALETRTHIFKEGLKGRVTDGILVRASQRIKTEGDAEASFPLLDQFLTQLVAASPKNTREMLVRE